MIAWYTQWNITKNTIHPRILKDEEELFKKNTSSIGFEEVFLKEVFDLIFILNFGPCIS